MKDGDILGHEFCGIVECVGPDAGQKVKPGDRVVCSVQIGCGECYYCKLKLSSVCERTNVNNMEKALYGRRTAGTYID
jgi:threonine dehydrogenase-like Zn-dependent dehydrogenase